MTLARCTFARLLSLCLFVSGAAMTAPRCCAQQTEDTTPATQEPVAVPAPAPIVRKAAKPASNAGDTTPANPTPHLTVSHPVAKSSTAATAKATAAAKGPTSPATPQTAPPGPFNRTVIVIDPAHGGADTGARISDSTSEKDVTLALAFRLRSLLGARGFTVVMTRDSDDVATTPGGAPGTPLSLDDRAGLANHARPLACLLLHATASGSGVHLYTSELESAPAEIPTAPWLKAQAPWVAQSQHLATLLGAAINRAKIPLVNNRASVRPVDSLTCPAVVVELAPAGSDAATLTDGGFQQRVAEALTNALIFWQNQAQPPPRVLPPPPPPPATPPPSSPATPSETQP